MFKILPSRESNDYCAFENLSYVVLPSKRFLVWTIIRKSKGRPNTKKTKNVKMLTAKTIGLPS
jgi:hypothetical protein